jgi:hypothetical protein
VWTVNSQRRKGRKINDLGSSDQKGCFCGYDEARTGSENRPDSGQKDVVNTRQNKGEKGRKSYEQKAPRICFDDRDA